MTRSRTSLCLALAVLNGIASANPAPTQVPVPMSGSDPEMTPNKVLNVPTKTLEARDILSEITGGVNSVLSALGSGIPAYVASGVPNFFQDFPTGDKVQSSLGIDDAQVSALPTQVLNLPPYANWTDKGWNVRFHGNVYKQPNTSTEKLNSLANIFLIGTDIDELPQDQQNNARNLTASIFILQQGDRNVSMHLEPAPSAGSSGQTGGGGAVTAPGGTQDLQLPYPTTPQGDFDVFLPIKQDNLVAGNQTELIQRVNVYATGATLGNATAYLVPPTGFTVISDIDDILRVTKIYQPNVGLLNSFARPFTAWMNMPDIYAGWAKTMPNMHFHYLTTTPEQATRPYMDFIYKTYPGGSFDTRPLNFSDVSATLKIRRFLLDKIFDTYPNRKFILVADTSNSDVMSAYPELAVQRPNQVQCIFLRNTSATDPGDKFPYNTKGFKTLKNNTFMFFKVPDDLAGLDIANQQCLNRSIPQNITFGLQDEVLGIHGSGAEMLKVRRSSMAGLVAAMAVGLFLFA